MSDPANTPDGKKEMAQRLIRRNGAAYARQMNWRMRWHDAAMYIAQNKGNIMTRISPGQQQTLHVYDTIGSECAEVMAAGMLTFTAPAGEQWFQLRPSASDEGAAAGWLDAVSQQMARVIHSSNFYEDAFECFHDLAVFSVCAMFIDDTDDFENPANFVQIPVGAFTIEEDARGRVNTLFRKFEFTARQCAEKWGEGALSEPMRELLKSDSDDKDARQFEILHCMYPRVEYELGLAPKRKRKYASVYVDIANTHVLDEGGHYEQPFVVCRLMRGNNEIYGRGPSDKAMPTIKLLQQVDRARLLFIDKVINPGWIAPDGSAYRIDNRAGGVTYWDASNPNNKPERVPVGERVDWVQLYAEEKRDAVRAAFYVPMFQMLSNPDEMRREKTAYEVEKMVQEKLMLFSPIFGRLVDEFFNPALRRLLGIMARKAMLPPAPDNIDVLDYDVDYISRIALAIKSSQSGALASMAQLVTQIAQIDPETAIVVNWPKAVRGTARNIGLPVEWQRTEDEVAQIQQAQAQAAMMAQMEQLAGAAQKGAAAAKNLGPQAQQQATDALSNMGGAAQ